MPDQAQIAAPAMTFVAAEALPRRDSCSIDVAVVATRRTNYNENLIALRIDADSSMISPISSCLSANYPYDPEDARGTDGENNVRPRRCVRCRTSEALPLCLYCRRVALSQLPTGMLSMPG